VGMLSTHTPVARLPKRAEVFGVVRSQFIALETIGENGFLRVAMKPLPEYSACISIFVIVVRWPLTSEDAGDVEARGREDGRWRRRTCLNKARKETSMNCCVSEVPLHCKELGLGAVFGVGKLHSTLLHVFQLNLVCPIPVYISDYPRVFEVD